MKSSKRQIYSGIYTVFLSLLVLAVSCFSDKSLNFFELLLPGAILLTGIQEVLSVISAEKLRKTGGGEAEDKTDGKDSKLKTVGIVKMAALTLMVILVCVGKFLSANLFSLIATAPGLVFVICVFMENWKLYDDPQKGSGK